jgi:diguanylate cyclase (GGDEF)-like protein
VSTAGRQFRVASFDAAGFRGAPIRVSVLGDRKATSSSITSSRLLAAGILGVFFLVAFGCAVWLSRSLQRQIAAFLAAARRLGRGDFSAKVPVAGNDEFAALGDEFNKMSAQLEARLEELSDQRVRLESSLQRVGEAFASNLDRDGLLELSSRTRVVSGGPLEERARVGQVSPFTKLLARVEAKVLDTHYPQEVEAEAGWALAHPLQIADGARGSDGAMPVLGLITVARSDRAFTPTEKELFGYLSGQAGVSIENVSLHETVQRQAVTDELTGLFNHRRFQEALVSEVERSKRFHQSMSLVMLDIDNFKSINDTYGHQQGDMVLREVARILRENSREIDAPARYGGEELAVVLPQTDQSGAFNLAERVRMGIEGLDLPLLEGRGTMSVTASLGVASLPSESAGASDLVAAADAALYKAKRSGKNCTMRAR